MNTHSLEIMDTYCDSFCRILRVSSDLLCGEPSTRQTLWFSLVLPTYNRTETFREALESVLNQHSVDFAWEILVVDNTPFDEYGETPALRIIKEIGEPRVL